MTTGIDEAVALHARALSTQDDHRYADTVRLCRRALDLFEEHAGPGHPDVANVLTLLASAEDELGEHAAAEAHHRAAVAILAALPAEGVLLVLSVEARVGLARCLRRQARYAEAEQLLVAALAAAATAPEYAGAGAAHLHNELGVLGKYAGRYDEAAAHYARARALLESAYGPDDPRLAPVLHNLAGLAHSRGEYAVGEGYARRSLELHRRAYPPGHPTIVADEAHLAALLTGLGRLDEAEPLLRRALAYFLDRYGPDHYEVLVAQHNLAAVLAERGELAEAEAHYRRALDGKRRSLGETHPEVALTRDNLAALVAG